MALDVLTQSEFFVSSLPGVGAVATVSTGLWPLDLVGLLILLLVFPDGRRTGRIWRAVVPAYAAATVMLVIAMWGSRKVDGQVEGGPTGGPRVVLLVAGLLLVAACLVGPPTICPSTLCMPHIAATVNAVAPTYASGTARQIRPGRRPSGNTSSRANRPTRSNGHSPVETVASAPSPAATTRRTRTG